jgi:hypothetical protein
MLKPQDTDREQFFDKAFRVTLDVAARLLLVTPQQLSKREEDALGRWTAIGLIAAFALAFVASWGFWIYWTERLPQMAVEALRLGGQI